MSQTLNIKLVGNSDDGYDISDSDVRRIKKLPSDSKVQLGPPDALKEFATGMYGDLHRSRSGMYTAADLQEWLESLE